MPFLQIALEQDLNEHEARLALDYIREYLPLRQSESRLYREASNFLLFEQPEHDMLTFEQELWLEQHKQAAHIRYTRFYASEAEGCHLCGDPFDSSPTGYCPRCGPTHSREATYLTFSLTQAGHAYLTYLARYIWGEVEAPYLRRVIQTFLSLFDAGFITSEILHATGPTQFEEKAQAFFQKQQTTCSLCGLPDEQCTCPHSSFDHQFRPFDNLFEREYVVTIPLPHKDASSLQAFADQHGLMVDALIGILIETPAIQIASASREAAVGHALSIDFAFQLSRIAKHAQGLPTSNHFHTVYDSTGKTLSWALWESAGLAASIAQAFPLLETSVPSLLFDQQQRVQYIDTLTWAKAQLATHDAASACKALPCTSDEIAALEALAGKPFPATYQAFLAWMGNGAGAFLQYLTCFSSSLPDLQTTARELLAHDSCQKRLPNDAWIITSLVGQHFTFFRLSEGDNPPVYAYRGEWRRTPFCKIAHHLSDFFAIQVALYAEYLQHGRFQSSSGKGLRQSFLTMLPHIETAMADQHQQQEHP